MAARARVAVPIALGLAISVYLALYQLGVVDGVWDPVFGTGSERILESSFSRALPVPDALLGAGAYLAELVLEFCGPADRWRSRPAIVVMLGLLALGMAIAGAVLTALQAFVYEHWCTLCLVSAAISIGVLAPVLAEALPAVGHVRCLRRRGVATLDALLGRIQPT